MMGLINGFFALILAISVLLFAISNTHNIDVFVTPFSEAFSLPLYMVALGLMAVGYVAGTFITWSAQSNLRRDRRTQKKRLRMLENELSNSPEKQSTDQPPSDLFPALPNIKK